MNKKLCFLLVSVLTILAVGLSSCAPAATATTAPAAPAATTAPAAPAATTAPAAPAATTAPATNTSGSQQPTPTSYPVAKVSPDKVYIGMVQHSAIPYTNQMKEGFDFACSDLKIKCDYNAPENIDPDSAIAMFETMLTLGTQAIMLNPAPPDAWTKEVQAARSKGIIVNEMDNVSSPASGFNAYVMPDAFAAAKTLAETLFAQLKKSGVTSGKVVWGLCAPSYTGQQLRGKGFQAACDEQKDFTCVGPSDTHQTAEDDYSFWETTVLQNPDAVAFSGNCAFDGPNLAKLKKLNNAKWGISTFDLEPDTLTGIQNGLITVGMGSNPYMNGYLATVLAYQHLTNGTPIGENLNIDTGSELVTKDNYAEYSARVNDPNAEHQYILNAMKSFPDLDSLLKPYNQ